MNCATNQSKDLFFVFVYVKAQINVVKTRAACDQNHLLNVTVELNSLPTLIYIKTFVR